jgi:hypothetical protein
MNDNKYEYYFIGYHLELYRVYSKMIDYKNGGLFIDFHYDYIKDGPSAL